MSDRRADLIRDMVDVARRLSAKGLVAATDGNITARLENGNFLTTRTALCKGAATPEDILEVTPAGEPVASSHKPSSELGMHLYIYAERPDVGAVVHAHPPYATAFAVAGLGMDDCVLPEVIVGLGAIPLADYATPSTSEVAASLSPYVKTATAVLLKNHGVVTYGRDLQDAYGKMEKVEHAAHILLLARLLGGEQKLSAQQLQKLASVSLAAYGRQIPEGSECAPAAPDAASPAEVPSNADLLSAIRHMIRS